MRRLSKSTTPAGLSPNHAFPLSKHWGPPQLKEDWAADYARWQGRDLSARRYVYVWADGVYLQARMEPAAECMLVIIGATPEGRKELVGFQVGMRESAQSWRELLVDIQGLGQFPRSAGMLS